MAKKQTFTSKLNKGGKDFKYVKHIKSVVSEDTGHIKFLHNMVRLEENENLDQALKRMEEESMQGLSFGKPTEDAKEEASSEEASNKETKEEAPAEVNPTEDAKEEASAEEASTKETKEEAPAEKTKEEAPAEVNPTEDAKEEASAEEASTKETKEEAEPASEEESAEKADDSSDK